MLLLSLLMAIVIGGYTPIPWWVRIVAILILFFVSWIAPLLSEFLSVGIIVIGFITALRMPQWALIIYCLLIGCYVFWWIFFGTELLKKQVVEVWYRHFERKMKRIHNQDSSEND